MITIPPNTYHSDLTALFWSYHPTDKEDDKLYELIRKVCKAELVHSRDNIEESLISKLVLTDEERLLVDKYKLTEHENIEVKARFLDVMLRFATGNSRIEKTRTASDAYLLLFKETNVNTDLVRCLQIRVIGQLYDEHFLKELKSLIISSFIHPGWLSEIINVIIKYIDGGLSNSHVQDILRAYQAKVDNQSTEWCDKYYDMLNAVGAISVEEYHYKKAVNWERRADFDEANKKENVFNARTHSIYEDAYKEIEKVQNNYHEDFLRIRDKYNQAKFAYSQILSQYGHKSKYGVPDQLVDDINKQMSCVTVRSLDESIKLYLSIPFYSANSFIIEQRAERHIKNSDVVLRFVSNNYTINNEGNVSGKTDFKTSIYIRTHREIRATLLYHIMMMFVRISECQPDYDEFLFHDILSEFRPDFIEEDRVQLWARAYRLFYDDDIASASHLLMPQLEHALHNLLEVIAGDVTMLGNDIQKEPSLEWVLKQLKKYSHKTLIDELELFFVNGNDVNYRNELMHGLIDTFNMVRHGHYLFYVANLLYFHGRDFLKLGFKGEKDGKK